MSLSQALNQFAQNLGRYLGRSLKTALFREKGKCANRPMGKLPPHGKQENAADLSCCCRQCRQ